MKSEKRPPIASPLPHVTAAPSSRKDWFVAIVNESRFGLLLLYLVSAICGVLLFVGGPDYYSPRSYRGAWSLGHIVAFFLWTLVLIRSFASFAAKPFNQQILIGLAVTLSLGFAIEWLQTFVGRTFFVGDVLRDLTGTLLAIAFLSPSRQALARVVRRATQVGALMLVLVQIYPVAVGLADEIIARRQFPVLSDLETWFERSRWESAFPLAVDKQIARQGRASLQARLMPGKYSGVGLVYFPRDWRGYSMLRFSVFNTQGATIAITCRIHDAQHIRNGEAYSDRFNERFTLAPGWTDIAIPLERVKNSPVGRTMDMSRVRALGIFMTDLDAPTALYIDAVRLE